MTKKKNIYWHSNLPKGHTIKLFILKTTMHWFLDNTDSTT